MRHAPLCCFLLAACAAGGSAARESAAPAAGASSGPLAAEDATPTSVAPLAQRSEIEPRAQHAPPAALDLPTAVARALADSPTLAEARARVEAARAAVDESEAAYWPSLDLGFDVARTDNPVQAFMAALNAREFELSGDLNDPDDTSQARLSATLSWLLWDGGARAARSGASALEHEAAELGRAAAARELAARVADAWLAAHEAQARRAGSESRARFLERALASARVRREEGAALRSEELSIEARLAAAREERERVEVERGLALEALRHLMGAPADEALELAPLTERWPITTPSWLLEDPAAVALDARQELRAAELATEVAERREDEARAGRAPEVDLVAGGYLDGSTPVLELDAESYLVGARLSWRAFEGFGAQARVRSARALQRAASAARDELRLAITAETRSALLRLDAARARRSASELQEASASEALRLVAEEHEAGAADVARLLSAEAELAAAHARHTAARFDEARALVELRRAAGLGPFDEVPAPRAAKDGGSGS